MYGTRRLRLFLPKGSTSSQGSSCHITTPGRIPRHTNPTRVRCSPHLRAPIHTICPHLSHLVILPNFHIHSSHSLPCPFPTTAYLLSPPFCSTNLSTDSLSPSQIIYPSPCACFLLLTCPLPLYSRPSTFHLSSSSPPLQPPSHVLLLWGVWSSPNSLPFS